MRLHPANFVKFDSPVGERWICDELRELFVVDRQDFRNNERRRFADFGKQILNLSKSREVFVIRTIPRQLQRGVVMDALHLHLERFFKLKNGGQRLRRLTYFALPLLKFRIGPLKPGEILLPFAYVSEKGRQVPLVGFWYLGTSWDRRRHLANVQRPTSNVQHRIQIGLLCGGLRPAALARLRAAPAGQTKRRDRRMARDQFKSAFGQFAARENFVPW